MHLTITHRNATQQHKSSQSHPCSTMPISIQGWMRRAAGAQVAKRELALECDYAYEARSQAQFRALVRGDPDLRDAVSVPEQGFMI